MSRIVVGLLMLVVLILLFLFFWIVTLSFALLFFGRKGDGQKEFSMEGPATGRETS